MLYQGGFSSSGTSLGLGLTLGQRVFLEIWSLSVSHEGRGEEVGVLLACLMHGHGLPQAGL